jgi:deoxyribonuclease V
LLIPPRRITASTKVYHEHRRGARRSNPLIAMKRLHPWNVSYHEAVTIQESLKDSVILKDLTGRIHRVAGADVSYAKGDETLYAGIVILSFPNLETLEEKWHKGVAPFPYIPGLLSFREVPFLLETLDKVAATPDLIFCDGQGIAHPRGLGLASHLGIWTGIPTLGCAKTRLVGEYREPGPERGAYSHLMVGGQRVGAVVRTRAGVKPIYVSPGYGITLQRAIEVALQVTGRFRLPEPIRAAHALVNRLRRTEGSAACIRPQRASRPVFE